MLWPPRSHTTHCCLKLPTPLVLIHIQFFALCFSENPTVVAYTLTNDPRSAPPRFLEEIKPSLPTENSSWLETIEPVFESSPWHSRRLERENLPFDPMSDYLSQNKALFCSLCYSKASSGSLPPGGNTLSVAMAS